MSEGDWTIEASWLLDDPVFQAELHARTYGRPGDSLNSALTLGTVWLSEEIEFASLRGELDGIRNLGMAGFILSAVSDNSNDRRVGHVAFNKANAKLVEAASRQQD